MNVEITNVIYGIVIIAAALTIIAVWGRVIYFGYRTKNLLVVLRSVAILLLFFVWVLIVLIQEWLASNTGTLQIYSGTYFAGFFVFLFTLISLWRIVFLFTRDPLKYLFKNNKYLLLMMACISTAYGLFYFFASGMLTIVLSSKIILPSESYLKISQSYGPLTIWPNIEFWVPGIQLFGVVSIAGVLMLLTLSCLIGVGSGLIICQWQLKKDMDMKLMSSTVGSGIALTTTCFVSCSLPAIYPLLVLFFGTAAADPLSRTLADSSGMLVNLTQMAALSVMAGSVIYGGQRMQAIIKK